MYYCQFSTYEVLYFMTFFHYTRINTTCVAWLKLNNHKSLTFFPFEKKLQNQRENKMIAPSGAGVPV